MSFTFCAFSFNFVWIWSIGEDSDKMLFYAGGVGVHCTEVWNTIFLSFIIYLFILFLLIIYMVIFLSDIVAETWPALTCFMLHVLFILTHNVV